MSDVRGNHVVLHLRRGEAGEGGGGEKEVGWAVCWQPLLLLLLLLLLLVDTGGLTASFRPLSLSVFTRAFQ